MSVPKNVITRSLGPEVEIEVDIEGPLAVELGDVFLLCSDGLSGPVDDHEIGAFAGNFHPRDACRYLINLANLRGGLDNITVLIVRIGPWVDPDSTESPLQDPARSASGTAATAPHGGIGWRAVQGPKKAAAALAPDEEHRYRSADCPIDETLIDRLDELTRVREAAIEQAWSVDWTELADLARKLAESRAAASTTGCPARDRRDHHHARPGCRYFPQDLRGQCALIDG